MGRVEEAVRAIVVQVVRREVKEALGPLAKEVRDLRQSLALLGKAVSPPRGAVSVPPTTGAQAPSVGLKVTQEEMLRARLTPGAIKRLRAKLDLTQLQLAALVGVTGPAVAQWEGGTSEPREANRAAVIALRRLSKREARRLLEARGIDLRPRGRKRRTAKAT